MWTNLIPLTGVDHEVFKGLKLLGVVDKTGQICFNDLYIKLWRRYGFANC